MNLAVTGELDGLAWLPSTGWISFGSVFPKTDTRIVTDTGVYGVSDPWHVSNLDATILDPGNGPQTTRITLDAAAPRRFLRVEAMVPLQP